MEVFVPKGQAWSKVPLSGAFSFKDGLGGIETVTNYTLKKVNRKRKSALDTQVGDKRSKPSPGSEEKKLKLSPGDKIKKKKSKKKNKGQKQLIGTKQDSKGNDNPEFNKKEVSAVANKIKSKKSKRKKTPKNAVDAETNENKLVNEDTETLVKNKKRKCRQKKRKPKPKTKITSNVEKDEDTLEEKEEVAVEDVALPEWDPLFVPTVLRKALFDLNFTSPTPIQQSVLPAAIKGRLDILGAAETGSGKTLAFGIPMITGILNDMERESNQPMEEESNDGEDDGGQEEEEVFEDDEFEDMSDAEAEMGCVKVVKDVEFDFEENEAEMFTPPIEIIEEIQAHEKSAQKLRGLVLAPTRELAIQVQKHLQALAKNTKLKIAVVVGGMAPQKQSRLLKHRPEIVVATPGRLWDLIREGDSHLATVRDIKYLVIDETDRMVEKGHFEELHKLLEMINENEKKKEKRQNFVFSATLAFVPDINPLQHGKQHQKVKFKKNTPEDKLKSIMSLIGMKDSRKIVDLTRKMGTAETLTESRIQASTTEKDFYLYYFLKMHAGKTLVFCNSIDCVRRLVNLFTYLNCSPNGLHAQMMQKQRLKSLERFVNDPSGLLIATDVAARGLDISGVEHVVHYQIPKTTETYVHRSGRTARAQNEGISVMLIDASENVLYRKMCRSLNRETDLPLFPIDKQMFSSCKTRVKLARELDQLKLNSKKESLNDTWWKKAAEEADIIFSEDEDEEEVESKEMERRNLRVKMLNKEAELDELLSKPILGEKFVGKYPTASGRLDHKLTRKEMPNKSAIKILDHDLQETARILKKQNTGKKGKFKKRKKQK